ncbi:MULTISPECIES: hypothetical protein [unclassified Methylophilus]|jgi:hypothetical protein|uniref:hypothetical protein n=1 Tax=unclassified Methylophilus TaxID=2630143 RepID=UPI00189079E4|nr:MULTISPECIES: hypothetical protein [unclassified Methylophilus]MBF5038692.1 hypothetical protein [Methylophilus sp. 13]MDF0376862.1 hypothetical protein [Methylophilus sp. YYY-1]BEV08138.1 hypothetical protein MTDW_14380 [Methylophilus sp. DW102]
MKKHLKTTLSIIALSTLATPLFAAEVCKVSMMGRVCFEEGSPELTAAHMKGDAVAESSAAKKKVDVAEAEKTKK